jgi:hypothetical protein
MTVIHSAAIDEGAPRYAGERVVAACFIIAIFAWGFGLYGHGVYLVELHPPARLAYLADLRRSIGLLLAQCHAGGVISDAVARLGPKRDRAGTAWAAARLDR